MTKLPVDGRPGHVHGRGKEREGPGLAKRLVIGTAMVLLLLWILLLVRLLLPELQAPAM